MLYRRVRVGFIEKIKCEEKNVRGWGSSLCKYQKRAFQRKDKLHKAGVCLEWSRCSEEVTVAGTQET